MNKAIPLRVFFDANIFFDILNKEAFKYEVCKLIYDYLLQKNITIYSTPTSFAINFYLAGKYYRNKELARKNILILFKAISFTREDYVIMQKVFNSDFIDLEDALQYFSAQDERVDCIITQNKFDYPKSAIPVYLPEEFIYKYFPL